MLWFFRGIRRGVVTTHYPARPDESSRFLPTPPAFRPWALTRSTAGRLEGACPSGALRLQDEDGERGGGRLVFDVGRCTACGRCAAEAPHAVTASGAFELAATSRSVLIKIIPLRGEAR
ncbi:MAG TPA: 4Fe-4S dicluster domain-containing protein [Trebonia sp.]|nr:4Fe-4S dicluster domain-containing protein [Trebonia sp.]